MSASSRRAAGSRLLLGGLVEDEDVRLHRQHRRDRHPPSLAEGQVVRRRSRGPPPRPLPAPRPPVPRARRPASRGCPDRRRRRRRTVGMKSWSSGSWKTMPTRRRTSSGSRRRRSSRDVTLPAGEHAVQVEHERGLARAVGPEQGDPLAGVDAQVEPAGPGARRDRRRPGPATSSDRDVRHARTPCRWPTGDERNDGGGQRSARAHATRVRTVPHRRDAGMAGRSRGRAWPGTRARPVRRTG